MIDPTDRGLTLGDGLFETVLAEAGALRHLDQHLARMAAGCSVLGLPPPDADDAAHLMRGALEGAGLMRARAAVRLTLTAGCGGRGLDRPEVLSTRLLATAAAAPRPTSPARVVVASMRRNEASPLSRLKTLAYLDNVLARREARAAGADEALMLNTRGELACAAAANLFWICDGQLFTPELRCGVLAGTVRARVLEAAAGAGLAPQEVSAGPEALYPAEAAFLTSSLIGLRPVESVDGRWLGEHPIIGTLAGLALD